MQTSTETQRLRLVPMGASVLRALLRGDVDEAERLAGAGGFSSIHAENTPLKLRLEQIEADPGLDGRLLQAIILRETNTVVGTVGFHTEPDAPYLLEQGLRGVELGYTVLEPYRRQGIATEAVTGMIAWGRSAFGISGFVASISPDNVPSLALVRRLGFWKVGSHMDEKDGLEDVYFLEAGD